MSDKDEFIALLRKFGVPYEEERRKCCGRGVEAVLMRADGRHAFGNETKVEGYGSFYTSFEFLDNGEFHVVGIWE